MSEVFDLLDITTKCLCSPGSLFLPLAAATLGSNLLWSLSLLLVWSSASITQLSQRSGDLLIHSRIFHLFTLKKGLLSCWVMKCCLMSFDTYDWIWAYWMLLCTSAFTLLPLSTLKSSIISESVLVPVAAIHTQAIIQAPAWQMRWCFGLLSCSFFLQTFLFPSFW